MAVLKAVQGDEFYLGLPAWLNLEHDRQRERWSVRRCDELRLVQRPALRGRRNRAAARHVVGTECAVPVTR